MKQEYTIRFWTSPESKIRADLRKTASHGQNFLCLPLYPFIPFFVGYNEGIISGKVIIELEDRCGGSEYTG